MYTLEQFREITRDLPGNFEIRIEAAFTPEESKTAPCFEIAYFRERKEVVLFPQAVSICDGETVLTVQHEQRREKIEGEQTAGEESV